MIKKISLILILCSAVIITLLEIFAYRHNLLSSVLISRIWLVLTAHSLIFGSIYFFKIIGQDLSSKNFWGILSILFIVIVVSYNLENFPLFLSGETTQHLAASLTNWKEPDLGFTRTIQLGFPSRQFLLLSLPSLIFGQSIITERSMYLFIFVFGILMFYTGLRVYYRNKPQINQVSSLLILAITSIPAVQTLYRIFDIPILPMSFFFISIGLFTISQVYKSVWAITAFTWSLTMLATTYTPGISAWIFMTGITFMLILKNLFKSKDYYFTYLLSICLLVSITIGLNALFFRSDIRINDTDMPTNQENISKVISTYEYVFVKNFDMWGIQMPFLGYVMFVPVVLYLVGGILGIWGIPHFIFSIWVLTTITIAGLSKGYSNPSPLWAVYRQPVILPVILTGLADVVIQKKITIPNKILYLLFIILIGYSLYISANLIESWNINSTSDLRLPVLRDALKTARKYSINPRSPIQLVTYAQNPELKFMPDHLLYFFPNAQYDVPENSCLNNFDLRKNALIYTNNNSCFQYLQQKGLFQFENFYIKVYNQNHQFIKAIYIPGQ
ncbi:hypothetical protein A2153_00330 [Candidatus Gottesmanbacteria bacterium RBG_16_38_7b]|uniref:Glycosyltransferase RgtA/B/C/D-like domain-containing protein n=1 Tax=Candidatus Gottesmanbacteria bacterium RBG_16_38_7b TaxID=1798372 RepID=A0A1F5YLF6_9BACT|nr:MAG: hypothetical protein A2153_00330 [Candidatus Gottesmanbacteria bacterium RBG_16_38_7b]